MHAHPLQDPVLDLSADRGVLSTFSAGRSGVTALAARATARGLTELGIADRPGPERGWLDAYLAAVRTADGVCAVRLRCSVEAGVLDGRGRLDLSQAVHSGLSRVDSVVLRPRLAERSGAEAAAEDRLLAALRAAATVPVPVLLAAPFAGLEERELSDGCVGELGWALARAGTAVLVDERLHSPGIRVAGLLAGAGVRLVAGSGARSAAAVGRWEHVASVAAAVAATVAGSRTRTAPEPDPGTHPAAPRVAPVSEAHGGNQL